MTANHHHTPEEERRIREAALDRTIDASFPASDPPSSDPNPDDDTVVAEPSFRNEEKPKPESQKRE